MVDVVEESEGQNVDNNGTGFGAITPLRYGNPAKAVYRSTPSKRQKKPTVSRHPKDKKQH